MIELYEEFIKNNPYCKELNRIGTAIIQSGSETNDAKVLQAQINEQTNRFEVGILISHDNPGALVYK